MAALQSPLTQVARPDVFEPKVVQLYKQLFQVGPRKIITQGPLDLRATDRPLWRQVRRILEGVVPTQTRYSSFREDPRGY